MGKHADLFAVFPAQGGLDTYKALMEDRIDDPIVTPDSHPSIDAMRAYLAHLVEEDSTDKQDAHGRRQREEVKTA